LTLKVTSYLNKISATAFLLWFYKCLSSPGLPDLIHRHCIDVLVGWEGKETTRHQDHQLKCKHRRNVDKRDVRKIGESILQGKSGYNMYRGWTQTDCQNKHCNINRKDEGT